MVVVKNQMSKIAQETLGFLRDLEDNNNREWLQANKKEFEGAKANFAEFVGDLIVGISEFDPEISGLAPDACIFRIYRDIRFSKDKSPYKTHFGAYISPGGRKINAPGYYIHIQPGGRSFLAAGKHMPEPKELLAIRQAVAGDTDEFLRIVENKKFIASFGELHGEKLKTAPKGFPADHAAIEYLKLKGFTVATPQEKDKVVTGANFTASVVKTFKETKPLIDFLRKALASG
jgi:uncharacterized protein (TIGR02453 family)